MRAERHRVHIERAEDEPAIGFDPRNLRQIVLGVAHDLFAIALRPGHPAQLPGVEEAPAVIGALERAAVALVPAAERRAPMRAAIVERADRALVVARDDQR